MDIIHIEQQKEWDDLVKSFPNYDVYYLSGYVKAFKHHGDGDPILLSYSDKNGSRAICVLMLRDISKDPLFENKIPSDKYYDAVTPYGYGGFLFDGEVDQKELSKEFHDLLKKENIISAFFRFHPVLVNAQNHCDIVNVIPLGKTIAIDLSSPEIIWQNITSKNRNMIRKAEKSGVEIHHASSPELFSVFKEIYDETMRGDNAEAYYFFDEGFYDSIIKDLNGNYQIFYATQNDKIISVAIMIFANDKMHYHLSGSRREYRSLAPSNLLLYKAALWGCEQGYKTFHLGGGVGSGEDPLYKFKAAFNRNSDYRFSIGKEIINNDDYNYILSLRNIPDEIAAEIKYFPQYRAHIE